MKDENTKKEVLIISFLLLLLCGAMFIRMNIHYDHLLKNTKFQTDRYPAR